MDYTMRLVTISLYIYWFAFWLLNGLDKLINRTDLGFFIWYGKDRTNQFSIYFERLGWSQDLYTPIIIFLFLIEILIAFVFLWSIFVVFRLNNHKQLKYQIAIKSPIILSILCFTGFSIWGIVTGDRAELLEHGTYLIALSTAYIISHFETIKT
jgi:hypothetical protein